MASGKRMQYRNDPIAYLVERLGYRRETLDWSLLPQYTNHKWDGDKDPFLKICRSLVKGKWCGVESATGVGKTHFGAGIGLWFLECWENSAVITIAPKEDQLTLHLWKEVSSLEEKFKVGVRYCDLQSLKMRMKPESDEWLMVGFIAGVTADEAKASATKAQGFHAEHMLFILEETPGIHQAVITAIENTCTAPHNLILAFGNPNNRQDELHKFCDRPSVTHVRMSGFDHPNVVLKNANFVPGAQSEAGLQRLLTKYADINHPLYMSRAKGVCPEQAVDSLIKYEWCKAAAERSRDRAQLGPPAMGVDVANSEAGDKAATARGEGSILIEVKDFQCPNSNQLGQDVFDLMKGFGMAPEQVGVDGVGVGAGTINKLIELGVLVQNLQGGAKQVDQSIHYTGGQKEGDELKQMRMEEKFDNLRSQMHWQLRIDLQFGEESGICLPNDPELFADLCAPKWLTLRDKVIKVESKPEIKKRLGRSPNKGDAVVYWNWVRLGHSGIGAASLGSDGDETNERQSEAVEVESDDPYKANRRRSW